jgi:hypothetical protein
VKENAEQLKETKRVIADIGKKFEKVCDNVGGLNRSLGGPDRDTNGGVFVEKVSTNCYGLNRILVNGGGAL